MGQFWNRKPRDRSARCMAAGCRSLTGVKKSSWLRTIGRTGRMKMGKPTTEAMLLEREFASATLDSIGEAVLRADLRGNVTYLNRMAEEMTGWSREEAR